MSETKQRPYEAAPSQQPAARFYRGKAVLTRDTFDYSAANAGDYVEQDVVDDAMNCLPPACMGIACSQRWASPIPTARTLQRASGAPLTPPSSGVWTRPASVNTAATAFRARLWSGAGTPYTVDKNGGYLWQF